MKNFEDKFEVLHLELDNEMDFNFLPLFNSKLEKKDDHFKAAKERDVNIFFICVIQILCL